MKVLILDDETKRALIWKKDLDSIVQGEVVVYRPDQVSELISELHKARLNARIEGSNYQPVESLNGFDLMIIDYDLLGLEVGKSAAWATGAELAYSMRLMSTVGPIVVVNQFGTNSYDLTMRRGVSSYADVDVGSAQITSPGLWRSDKFEGFRPWGWPDLHKEVERFSLIQGFVLENLDHPVMSALGFELENAESTSFISYELAAFLGAGPRNKGITFRDVVIKNAGLRVFNILEKDHDILEKLPDDQIARICTAILTHWLEKVVLPAQEVIADAPHLCSQLPWAIKEPSNLENWMNVCSLRAEAVPEMLSRYRVEPHFLFSRPVFWAENARREIPIPEGFQFSDLPAIQFCENLSVFSQEADSSSFPSDVIAFDKKRWIRSDDKSGASNVNYEPQSYLLM
ncbi:TPA: hypothetical protein ACRNCK_001004 [Pseudomonas aeruginosa]|uniref:hypothetical protein n=2 Tax=Pseudomonas aeruginosa TaxID=287 RepID=UPI0015717F84|nr:hypothetical protein [Pseudomonas aeruginosa]NTT91184.1 hypothetical protein [Pseudomonas aeruginosa]WCU89370.1 hypothetical protein KKY69_05555 [Pseudomonas aeruginosa]HCF3155258.1 hypothetical protein [Pseudomonas aeruginosa]HCF7344898.1 hypothetical protein [Pseudomonas aeruginosa]HDR2971092.1 hypothetical protein [Pseudomonas aeruginosa]